ncbi:hypothetical protein llap_5112 [Limosa lapponica baueri]|uniref:Secreted protein n=1 Tax=Limosa lapponica baueri TaxID=1758121 RepID=A0A2I0UEX2_LIMLA|nr:hypothetical protein llap_5112 [Limosa lapponica baueri]
MELAPRKVGILALLQPLRLLLTHQIRAEDSFSHQTKCKAHDSNSNEIHVRIRATHRARFLLSSGSRQPIEQTSVRGLACRPLLVYNMFLGISFPPVLHLVVVEESYRGSHDGAVLGKEGCELGEHPGVQGSPVEPTTESRTGDPCSEHS